MLFEGESKQILSTDQADMVVIRFKDTIGSVDMKLEGKGKVCCSLNKFFFSLMEGQIPTHYIADFDETSFIARKLKMLPVKVVVRNFAAGSICERQNVQKGTWFPYPYVEYLIKDENLETFYLTEEEVVKKGILDFEEAVLLTDASKMISKIVYDRLNSSDLKLIDITLMFGKDVNEGYFLADEMTPDTMRISSKSTDVSFGKDELSSEAAKLVGSYNLLAEKLGVK